MSDLTDRNPDLDHTMKSRLPLFETIAAVVAVAAVAFLTALPATKASGESNVALHDSLSVLRTAVFRYSMDHQLAGSPLMPGEGGDFLEQLTGRSRSDGRTIVQDQAEDRFFGPYLDSIPVNPVNQLNTVRVMPEGFQEPVLNGSAGWVYLPSTGEVFADLPGNDDRGIAYLTY